MKKSPASGRLSVLAIGCCSVILLNPGASAAFLTIDNPSFEYPAQNPGVAANTINGWTRTGSAGVWNPGSQYYNNIGHPLPNGSQVGWSSGGTATQTLVATLQPNTTYTLSIAVGGRNDISPGVGTSYAVQLLVAGSPVAWVTPVTPPILAWTTLTATYTSPSSVLAGQHLVILISATQRQLDFDNVKLEATSVPEPSTYLAGLSALGMLGVFGWRTRKLR